ncbi:uncharacterized protein TRIADDRAFT_55130 [Trichoplax adhaerens]|uniref:Protein kinase domain-containing protein n=1 Tax=Trichoplax adhaerens TaxID=10228 RepID=B3RU23_TRIAD|nr:predicted protein [Trichoplax adhaerens]EDV25268.1 predicted protein [Trichoplax adhaerens]|eukprot:XP_002111301.1 predicted protein [Trichoplax adhaerens]
MGETTFTLGSGLTEDQIDQIEDFEIAMKLLKARKSDIGNMAMTLDDVKDILKLCINGERRKNSQLSTVINQSVKACEENKIELMRLTNAFHDDIVASVDELMREEWHAAMFNVDHKLQTISTQLADTRCRLLVVGESGAGKSSFINLLLGYDILPNGFEFPTTCPCELHYSTRPAIHLYTDCHGSSEPIIVQLDHNLGFSEQLINFTSCCDDQNNYYQRAEIFLPLPILKHGLVIIDTPGIDTGEDTIKQLMSYLPLITGVIYVTRCDDDIKLQENQFMDLLSIMYYEYQKLFERLSPKSVIFICTHKDYMMPQESIEDLQSKIRAKMLTYWRGCTETQIHFLSITKAIHYFHLGYISDELYCIIGGLQRLVIDGMNDKVLKQGETLQNLLDSILFRYRVRLQNFDKNHHQREEEIENLLKILDQLTIEVEEKDVLKDTMDLMKEKQETIIHNIVSFLQSPQAKEQLLQWSDSDLPSGEGMKIIDSIIQKKINRRYITIVNEWEEKEQMFAQFRRELIERLEEKFGAIANTLDKYRNEVIVHSTITSHGKASYPSNTLFHRAFSTSEKVAIGVTSPIWVPAGLLAAVIALPVMGFKFTLTSLSERRKKHKYNKDKIKYVQEIVEASLESITVPGRLNSLVEGHIKPIIEYYTKMSSEIPGILKTEKSLLQKELNHIHNNQFIYEDTLDILQFGQQLLEDIATFKYTKLKQHQFYKMEDILDLNLKNPILQQEKSSMYFSRLKKCGGEIIPITLNITNQPADNDINQDEAKCILQVLNTESILRNLNHRNIIAFYGLVVDPERIQSPYLAFEQIKMTLRSYFFDYMANVPSYYDEHDTNMMETYHVVIRYATQIISALDYMHTYGYIYKNLNLDTIALSHSNEIKLCEFGYVTTSSQPEDDASSHFYIAPEVLTGKRIYNVKADTYSFAMVMYEMWYGSYAEEAMPEKEDDKKEIDEKNYIDAITQSKRPSLEFTPQPPKAWIDLMVQCWSLNPVSRPTTADILLCLSKCTYKDC